MNLSNLILAAMAFAAIYPLYFWIPADRSFANKFCKLNITLPNAVGGIVLVIVWLLDIPLSLKMAVTAWKAILFAVSNYSWKKKCADPKLMTIPCLIGIYVFMRMQAYFAVSGGAIVFIDFLGR